jgi:hypothetical protein
VQFKGGMYVPVVPFTCYTVLEPKK